MEVITIHSDIKKHIDSLSDITEAKVLRFIDLLALQGYRLTMPYSKKVEKNLYELRVTGEQNIRIFYTFHLDRIVLLHIISKKTQKLQRKDLETARHRLKWLR